MIRVQEAIQRALAFLKEVYGVPPAGTYQLEEVEISEDERYWLVTFSFLKQEVSPLATDMLAKQYKVVKLDAGNGQPLAVKIREMA